MEHKKYVHFFRTGDIFVTPPFHPVLTEKNVNAHFLGLLEMYTHGTNKLCVISWATCVHHQWPHVITEEMSEETLLDHDKIGPQTSPEPHRRITEPHRRITINILGIFGTSLLLLITPTGNPRTFLPITKASRCTIGWSDSCCGGVYWIYFTRKEELSPLLYHIKSLHIISRHISIYGDKLPYMKKTRKKKQVCGAACFMAAEIIFSKDVRPSVHPSCLSVCLSVRPSICLSVCLSHLFHYVPIIISSWKFQELLPLIEVMSMQKVKINLQFEIWNKIQNISLPEIYMKMLSAKWQPFNVLRILSMFLLTWYHQTSHFQDIFFYPVT